jgi:pyruvate/2-oxoglutarate dehydrogenase complex dihydrolipoamide acyltransferase (E2) component
MFPTGANSTTTRSRSAGQRGLARLASLTIAIGCLGLSACGGSSSSRASSANAHTTASTASAQATTTDPGAKTPASPAQRKEVTAIKALVQCLRRHGIQLPEPEASGHVDSQGVDLNSPRYKAALTACLRERQSQLQAGG